MSLVIGLIDLVAKHKAGELRCPATALIIKCKLYPRVRIICRDMFFNDMKSETEIRVRL